MEWIKDYMKEVSVIIIGLCITYYGDSLVDGYYERKDDSEYMEMLKTELNDNIVELRKMMRYYRRDRRLAELLKTGDAGMAEDSLLNQHRYYHYWMLKDNVFSIMKETGTFSRMEKHNVTVIYECYEYMNTALHMGEVYRERRFAELLEHMAGYSDCYNAGEMNAADEMKLIMKDKRFCGYFTRTVPPMAGSAVGICMFTETKITEVIKMLEAD